MLKAVRRLLFGGDPPAAPRAPVPPADVQALLQAPARAAAEGRPDEAIRMLEALLQAHPDAGDAHLLLGTLQHQRGEMEEARDSYTLATHFAPQSWRAHYHLGLLDLEDGRAAHAARALEQALVHSGPNPRVHNALGAAYIKARAFESAVEQFRLAIALDAGYAEARSNLGYVLFRELEEYTAGASYIEQALALEPERPATLLNWALVLQQRGRSHEALRVYDRLLEADPGFDEARLNRGLILLARGELSRGWEDYEARKVLASPGAAGARRKDEWDGSDLAGSGIVLYGEQGLGDEIMFASCVPDILRTAGRCVIECNPKLTVLFRRSFPQAIVRAAGETDTSAPAVQHRAEWRSAIGSVPRFLRKSGSDFPAHPGYLRADPARVSYWTERLAALPGRRKVGISWRGGAPSTRGSLRSVPLEQWRGVLRLAGIDFVSLQYTDCSAEIAEVAASSGTRVHHWREALDGYDETAALVSALDLVISVQTAAVHLSGALGVATWALIPETPEWRYGEDGEAMRWYPSVTLVRKQRGEDWTHVLARVEQRLASALGDGGPRG